MPVQNVGFEDIAIRYAVGWYSYSAVSLDFKMAANCWVYGCELWQTASSHIRIECSSEISVQGCYIHHSNDYSGKFGYGVVVSNSSSNCLIENNIFSNLRHAMMPTYGAVKNVFSYNNSNNMEWSGPESYLYTKPGDIRMHGNMTSANLIEHNHVDRIWADDTHGWNGYYNTYFMNWADDIIITMSFVSSLADNTCRSLDLSELDPPHDIWETNNNSSNHKYDAGGNSYYLRTTPDWLSGYDPSCTEFIPAGARDLDNVKRTLTGPYTNGFINVNFNQIQCESPLASVHYYIDGIPFDATVSSGKAFPIGATLSVDSAPQGYKFAGWSDNSMENPRTFNPSADCSIYARFKKIHYSNNSNTFVNNGQRKFIRTAEGTNGTLHMVYESMGKVWYEVSTDNGSNWRVANNGSPLNNGADAKSPSITCFNNNTVITYTDASGRNIYAESHNAPGTNFVTFKNRILVNDFESGLATVSTPVVTVNSQGLVIVAWKAGTTGAIVYRLCSLDLYSWTITALSDQYGNQTYGAISSTSGYSNPTIEANTQDRINNTFHLACQEGTSNIKYTKITAAYASGAYHLSNSTIQTPSQNTGIDMNSNPCITALDNGTARIAWKGSFDDMSFTIFMDPTNPANSTFWMFGSNVSSPVINAGSETYYIGWTENQSGSFVTKAAGSATLSSIKTLDNLFGEYIQMNGNGLRSQMYVSALNTPAGSPYKFTQSGAITSILKESQIMTGSGKVAFLTKDSSVTYYCALGDIISDGKQIKFSEKSDTVRLDNFNKLNKCLISEPFLLNNNSRLNYTMAYGAISHDSKIQSLKGNEYATLTVELIDEASQKVIGSLSKVTFDREIQDSSSKIYSYEVNTQGIGNATVRLRLNVNDNINPVYSLAHRYATGAILNKLSGNRKIEINLLPNSVITEYKLNQNYPNPFNPATVINYQIPKTAKVSLKVYDLLGKEVAALVNENKEAGSYNVQFNAENLPSGLYLYELRADDFISCKKLLLLK